jgi:hypothetical protein
MEHNSMRTYKIHQDYYPDFQQAVDATFEDEFIKTGRCENVFPPEMEADEDGFITFKVKDWLYNLPDMPQFLNLLDEIKP